MASLWFLPMERHEEWLTSWIQEGKIHGKQLTQPQRVEEPSNRASNELDKLRGLSLEQWTRDLDWGVKVPLKEQMEKYCMYG